jgi:hypothetical protein
MHCHQEVQEGWKQIDRQGQIHHDFLVHVKVKLASTNIRQSGYSCVVLCMCKQELYITTISYAHLCCKCFSLAERLHDAFCSA